ncbi:Cof-type HAD-IIB family hydrolase [Fodinisporobacter ferrooxydans]|uniref:Cof-type HAD-IIB family hydrolase n=1 Tax=Fodinisporobacter ferrooxydans TaxID=2901836 RepID=A0ABY4CJM9_9BACL|nr:Cof-type HAD-IIB family hydrolase [Alicyclobacillaceae bacterium MYW30-H2]
MAYKIVFFDIDGTLVNHEKQIPEDTKWAVQQLQKQGVLTAIATGRAPFHLAAIAKQLNIDTFVSFNGSFVVYKGKTIFENPLHSQKLQDLQTYATNLNHPLVFLDHQQCFANANKHSHIEQSFQDLRVPSPLYKNPDFNTNIYQALLYCQKHEEVHYNGKFGDFAFIRWHKFSMDVLPSNGSKAIGIKKLLEHIGLSKEETIAFGDGLNDREMLSYVGLGIAMGNAKPEVQQYAKFVTRSVDGGGIRYGLQTAGLIS